MRITPTLALELCGVTAEASAAIVMEDEDVRRI
jgi:hypothetical protein